MACLGESTDSDVCNFHLLVKLFALVYNASGILPPSTSSFEQIYFIVRVVEYDKLFQQVLLLYSYMLRKYNQT